MKHYILTGTPGSGKTSIIRALEIQGATVVNEAATDLISYKALQGDLTPWEQADFIDDIVKLQQQRQRFCCQHKGIIFYDRSPICTYALAQYLGFTPSANLVKAIEHLQKNSSYEKRVFFIKELGFITNTNARKITHHEALKFEKIHLDIYQQFGYECIIIPALDLDARVGMILRVV